MSFRIAWLSCEERPKVLTAGYIIRSMGCVACYALGDSPYSNVGASVFGTTTTSVNENSTQADFDAIHDQMHNNPGWQALHPILRKIGDDHDLGAGDNWDHTYAQAISGGQPLSVTNDAAGQALINAHFQHGAAAMQKAIATYCQNPPNTDPEAVPVVPSGATAHGQTPDADDYPVMYFRESFDSEGRIVTAGGAVEVFVPDNISYRSPLAATDNASKTPWGAPQEQWLEERIIASDAEFKVIMSSKKFFANSGADNTDTLSKYSTVRDRVMNAIIAAGVTGLVIPCGDRHVPQFQQHTNYACLNACPVGVPNNADGVDTTLTEGVRWWDLKQLFGLMEYDSENNRLVFTYRHSYTGAVLWGPAYLEAGSNTLTYPRPKLAGF